MTETKQQPPEPSNADESKQASINEPNPPGFFAEFVQFLKEEKKWWLTPIIISIIVIILAALLLRTPDAPFIYPSF